MNEQYKVQVEQAKKTIKTHPWFLLSTGPSLKPCSIHSGNEGLVLPVNHNYWLEYPLKTYEGCKCKFRKLSKREFERLKQTGVQDSNAPPLLNEKGKMSGRMQKKIIPIKLDPA